MIRALLAGTKTQTRRALKVQPVLATPVDGVHEWRFAWPNGSVGAYRCPYGVPGDALWVRETTYFPRIYDRLKPSLIPDTSPVRYVADGAIHETKLPIYEWGKQRVSIHMPRWASRISLRITDVRVERLNEISEEDALAEGVVWSSEWQGFVVPGVAHPNPDFPALSRATPRECYAALWDVINGSGEWLANPWVFAVSFEKV